MELKQDYIAFYNGLCYLLIAPLMELKHGKTIKEKLKSGNF